MHRFWYNCRIMTRTTVSLAFFVAVSCAMHGALARGALCLTFDDRNFDAWEKNIPLFAKYGAHATFFVYGPIDARAEECLRSLSAAGHSIGLHGFGHRRAPELLDKLGEEGFVREEILPQLSVCRAKGLPVRSYAYPFSSRTPQTDALLLRHFGRLRAGWGGDSTPRTMDEVSGMRVLVGMCGTHPDDVPKKIAAMMPMLAASNSVLVAYAHSIESDGDGHDNHHMKSADLEAILAAAKAAGVGIVGFDELPGTPPAPELSEIRYDFSRQRLFPGFDGKFCKVQPSVATDGKGTALIAFQRLLLSGMDVFYGQFMSRSADGGATWSEPVEMKVAKDVFEDGFRVTRYATVYYGGKSGRWFAVGSADLYADDRTPYLKCKNGRPYVRPIQMFVDAVRGEYTGFRDLTFPLPYEMAKPFGQVLECDNGDILVPFYFCPPGNGFKTRIVTVRYAFRGDLLEVVKVGVPVARDGLVRGLCEPSLARLGGKVYMTIRSDEVGLWAVSDDGLEFSTPRPWTWTDGSRIGNRNTQQHWVSASGGLFLAYTREDASNGHVFRNRAPIFMARFDPVCGGLVRDTERQLVPELGARLGNFCVAETAGENWLAVAEWMQPRGCERYGSDNSIWLVKIKTGRSQ